MWNTAISFVLAAAPFLAPAPDLPEHLEEALSDLRQRAPEMAAEVERALDREDEAAIEFLEEHAEYLEELREAPPELRALLLRQESMALEADTLADKVHDMDEEAAEVTLAAAHTALEQHLEEWFDLRQEIRGLELQFIQKEIEDIEEFMFEINDGEGFEEARGLWMQRLVEGGMEVLAERLEEWEDFAYWETLEPTLIEMFAEEEELSIEEAEDLPFEELIDWAEEEDERILKAEEQAGPEFELGQQLFALGSFLLVNTENGESVIGNKEAAKVFDEGLTRLVELEAELGWIELELLNEELAFGYELLARREEARETILELQFAEVLGYAEVYEW